MAVKNCFIRGSVVRYVQLPAEHVDTQLLEDATRRGMRSSSKAKYPAHRHFFRGCCTEQAMILGMVSDTLLELGVVGAICRCAHAVVYSISHAIVFSVIIAPPFSVTTMNDSDDSSFRGLRVRSIPLSAALSCLLRQGRVSNSVDVPCTRGSLLVPRNSMHDLIYGHSAAIQGRFCAESEA